MTTYLFAHSNPDGTGIAQCAITGASTYTEAREAFRLLYPLRVLCTTGELGR